MAGRTGGGGVLDSLAMPPLVAPTSPNPGPADPYNHAQVQKAIAVIQANPGISASMAQQIMSEALGPAQHQQNRSDYAANLSSAAVQPGMTPEMLAALANAQNPGLAAKPYGANVLDQLSSAIPGAEPSSALPPEDMTAIDTEVATLAADPNATLHDAIMHFLVRFRAAGAPQEVQDTAVKYITAVWGQAKGWDPGVSQTAPPPPAAAAPTGTPIFQPGGTSPYITNPNAPSSGILDALSGLTNRPVGKPLFGPNTGLTNQALYGNR
jgi:hypothetical protein